MEPDYRNEFIAKYEAGYEEVAAALKNFPSAHLKAHPIEGKWSAWRDRSSPGRQRNQFCDQAAKVAC